MKLLYQILNIGVAEENSELHNFTIKLLNQIAVVSIVSICVYIYAHISLQNNWLAVALDFFYIITGLLILYFNSKKKFISSYFTVGIGYTISFTGSSLLIGSQNQIEYLLLISSIGTALLLDNHKYKKVFFYSILLIFIALKTFFIYHPQGLLGTEFSPYFKIVNGSLVFIFVYIIVNKTINNSHLLLKKLQSRNEEISNLNATLETKVQLRTKALNQSNKELKKLAYIAAHDLREPLRNILGFSKLLKKSIANNNNKEIETNLSYIDWSVRRIDTITRDIVIYIELEDQMNHTSMIDLNKIVESIIKENRNDTFEFQMDKLPTININSKFIQIIFENLITNAIQYSDKPINEISLNYKQDLNYHYFKISDNGIGIKAQYHEKIFEMFTRLHNDFDRSGSGNGLALCKKIIESYGGKIWLESEYKKGSNFHFTLPIRLKKT